jgi:peptidoglycan hydrolase CwlO-like protein
MPPVSAKKADEPTDIKDLIASVQTAYDTVKTKSAAKDKATDALQKASQDYTEAVNTLNAYRAQLNDILGNVAQDPRIRMSA